MATVINDFTVEPRVDSVPPPPAESHKPKAEMEREIETAVRRERQRAERAWAY